MGMSPMCLRAGESWVGCPHWFLKRLCFYNQRIDAVEEVRVDGTNRGPVGFLPEVFL